MNVDRMKEICSLCNSFDKENQVCQECGCWMKIKWYLPFVDCPLGKWDEI